VRKPTNILQELQEEFPDELLNSLPFTQKDIDNIIQQGMHLEDILKENPEEEE
jgi:hypothetical protein